MEQITFDKILSEAQQIIGELEWWYWAAIGGGLFLIFLLSSSRRSRKRKRKKYLPNFVLHAFQVAPLGRDAFFKIRNIGEQAVLSTLWIKGRRDILVKNAVAGQQVGKNKEYSILLETSSPDKIRSDFTVELIYIDQVGNVYKQTFPLEKQTAKRPKLIKSVRLS